MGRRNSLLRTPKLTGNFLFSLLLGKLERVILFRQIELRAGIGLRISPLKIIYMRKFRPEQSKMTLR